LADNICVGEANDESVFGAVVFVLVLGDQPFAGIEIGLSFAPTSVLDLVALEIRLVLDNLDETLWFSKERCEH